MTIVEAGTCPIRNPGLMAKPIRYQPHARVLAVFVEKSSPRATVSTPVLEGASVLVLTCFLPDQKYSGRIETPKHCSNASSKASFALRHITACGKRTRRTTLPCIMPTIRAMLWTGRRILKVVPCQIVHGLAIPSRQPFSQIENLKNTSRSTVPYNSSGLYNEFS